MHDYFYYFVILFLFPWPPGECPVGTYCPSGSAVPIGCAAGSCQDLTTQPSCLPAPPDATAWPTPLAIHPHPAPLVSFKMFWSVSISLSISVSLFLYNCLIASSYTNKPCPTGGCSFSVTLSFSITLCLKLVNGSNYIIIPCPAGALAFFVLLLLLFYGLVYVSFFVSQCPTGR